MNDGRGVHSRDPATGTADDKGALDVHPEDQGVSKNRILVFLLVFNKRDCPERVVVSNTWMPLSVRFLMILSLLVRGLFLCIVI